MKVYLDQTVLEAAKERLRWVFDEFETVVASVSGGKDSTVVFELALEIAREKGRLPLKVMFLDQEAEWQATIDAVRVIMENPDVEPFWIQVPFKLFNATSTEEHWLQCWDPKEESRWMRPKESYAVKENTFGTERFSKMFGGIAKALFPPKTAYVAGVRCEESPTRSAGLTGRASYKWVTWARGLEGNRGNVTFYPIYDWTTADVWKAIHDHSWPYCRLYDTLYRYGVPTTRMRVSNVHHETAVWSLFVLQEIEPKTYERLVGRISGIDMAGKMGIDDYFPKSLPPMFGSWKEYRDYLLEKLITNEKWVAGFKKTFGMHDEIFEGHKSDQELHSMHVMSILCNDWEGVKLGNYLNAPQNLDLVQAWRTRKREEKLANV